MIDYNYKVVIGLIILNYYISFKNEMGYTDVCNQYVEMLLRSFHKEHAEILADNKQLESYSKEFQINLKDKSGNLETRLAQNYIINIHSTFSGFLYSYKSLDGCPLDFSIKAPDENILTFIVNNLYNSGIPDKISILYYVCTYYRLLRNHIIHNEQVESSELRIIKSNVFGNAKIEIKKELFGKLNVAHSCQDLSFDDQVLFSKCAILLAKHIAYDSTYDLVKHIKKNKSQLINRYKKFESTERRKIYLKNYFRHIYPITDIQKYDEQLNTLISIL